MHIGAIYGYDGYRYPTFWTEGYSTPTFQDEKVKNLLSPAVNRGDLWRLNYNKTVLGPVSPGPQSRMRRGISLLPSRSPPLSPRDPRAPCSPSELVPHFLDQSYALENA